MVLSIENRMLYRIRAKGRGWVFSARHFLDFGSRQAVDLALYRLVKKHEIRKLGRGIYDYPRQSQTLGQLSPSINAVAQEIAAKNNSKLKITGAQAANALGLSTQVPARIIYLTDGPSRQLRIGNQTIVLKHASPRTMATAGKGSGAVIQALEYIGKERVTTEVIENIKSKLSNEEKLELKKDLETAPQWLRSTLNEIIS